MEAGEEDSRILINDLKLIGIEAAFMQKAIVRAFRSKASLVETLRERETVEQKMNVLRQTPLDGCFLPLPPPLCSAFTFPGYLPEKVKVECACFVIFCEFLSIFLSVYSQIPCDQGAMPKHVMSV